MKLLALASTLFALSALVPSAAADPAPTPWVIPTEVVGQVQLVPGVPCASCTVALEGAPVSARTNAHGWFVLPHFPSGTYTVKVASADGQWRTELALSVPLEETRDNHRRNTVYLPTIVVTRPGAVAGKLVVESTDDVDAAVIAIPELGLFTKPTISGHFLLTGVAPGSYTVTVLDVDARILPRTVHVSPGGLTTIELAPLGPLPTRPPRR
jgi:hypothetical protein